MSTMPKQEGISKTIDMGIEKNDVPTPTPKPAQLNQSHDKDKKK